MRLVVLLLALSACARIGDDRFPKQPDAAPPDALNVTPDAAGPPDAAGGPDAAADAAAPAPDAP